MQFRVEDKPYENNLLHDQTFLNSFFILLSFICTYQVSLIFHCLLFLHSIFLPMRKENKITYPPLHCCILHTLMSLMFMTYLMF